LKLARRSRQRARLIKPIHDGSLPSWHLRSTAATVVHEENRLGVRVTHYTTGNHCRDRRLWKLQPFGWAFTGCGFQMGAGTDRLPASGGPGAEPGEYRFRRCQLRKIDADRHHANSSFSWTGAGKSESGTGKSGGIGPV